VRNYINVAYCDTKLRGDEAHRCEIVSHYINSFIISSFRLADVITKPKELAHFASSPFGSDADNSIDNMVNVEIGATNSTPNMMGLSAGNSNSFPCHEYQVGCH